jgi:hypothetical protein
MNKKINFFLSLLVTTVLISCNFNPKKPPSEGETKEKKTITVKVPDFNSDSAYSYVVQQLAFGPRVMNSIAHEKCAAFLINKLKSWCQDVTVQKGTVKAYNGALLKFSNIIASFNPGTNDRIFLCSHWDSRPYADHDPDPKNHNKPIDGANDGASGVGILFDIARQLSASNPPIGVDIILFDAEDYGPPQDWKSNESTEQYWGLGSQYWANQPHRADYFAKYGILLDMVGAPNATFLEEALSMHYAPDIVKLVWETANRIGFSRYFLYDEGPQITDDHVPLNKIRGIPTIDIIHLDRNSDTGFYPYWHTTKDNLASIDKNTLNAVGQTLLTVIYNER